jgi:serine/threonine protein phosphatase PrpC
MNTITNPILLQSLKIQYGQVDDIGNNRTQQDDSCVIIKPEINCAVFAVADGHSSETGHIAANACIAAIKEFTDANLVILAENPLEFLERCYAHAQEQIREAFTKHYVDKGFEVKHENGILLKRRFPSNGFTNIGGGSMLTITVLNGTKLYVANVGDCAAQLCVNEPILKNSMLKYEIDVATGKTELEVVETDTSFASSAAAGASCDEDSVTETKLTHLALTRDHSPMSADEYRRVREFRPSPADPNKAELLFVYDEQDTPKPYCEPVFSVAEDGTPVVRDDVTYYCKNVSKERATYVSVPNDANYTDALASARAMGDFNIGNYGVSPKPEIQSVDLSAVFERTDVACMVIATDGVWDNWIPDHVTKFMMDKSCLSAIDADLEKGALRVTKSFMIRNNGFAQRNFKGNADNATSIVVYLKPRELTHVPMKESDLKIEEVDE